MEDRISELEYAKKLADHHDGVLCNIFIFTRRTVIACNDGENGIGRSTNAPEA